METKMEKRSRTEIRSAIEGLSEMVKAKPVGEVKVEVHGDHDHDHDHDHAFIPIKPFLSVCNSVLQVLGWLLSLSFSL